MFNLAYGASFSDHINDSYKNTMDPLMIQREPTVCSYVHSVAIYDNRSALLDTVCLLPFGAVPGGPVFLPRLRACLG